MGLPASAISVGHAGRVSYVAQIIQAGGMATTEPSKQQLRQWRTLGHKLKPVVTVAGNGVSDGVLGELDRALADHELVKVRVAAGDREARAEAAEALCEASGALLVQAVGNVLLLLRKNPDADPRLSNLQRTL
jgi:RNA-binding protein